MNRHRTTYLIAAVAATGLLVAGCGDDSSSSSPSDSSSGASSAKSESLAKLVPADIAATGTLTVGTDATYAPNEFLADDGKTVQGFDIDLFNEVAAKLGLTTKYVPAPFDNIIPSVQSGKYQTGVSSFTINPERLQVVDMVSYYSAGTAWAAASGNPTGISPEDACGMRVAVQRGTVQIEDITARSDACVADGKAAISIDQFQGQDQATSAVVSGKDDAMLSDSTVIAYAIEQTNGQLEQLGEIYDAAPYGYAVAQNQGDLAKALSGAVNELIEDGTYVEVLEKWSVEQGAIAKSEVNPSVS